MTENSTPPIDPPPPRSADDEPADTAAVNPLPTGSGSGRLTIGIAVSWLLILAAISISQIPQFRERPPARNNVEKDITLQFTGRYIVGMKILLGSTPVLEGGMPQLEKALETSDNPRKYLFFFPIRMELTASEEAFTELERLANNPSNDSISKDASLFLLLYRNGSDSLTPSQVEAIKQYGWIGELALSHDKPESDPMRRSVIKSAVQTFIITILSVIAISGVLVVGMILFVSALVLWKKGRLQSRFRRSGKPGNALLESFALFIAGIIALPGLAQLLSPQLETVTALLSFPIVILALVWPRLRGEKWKDAFMAIGWYRGQGILREMGAGILGYIAGLPLLAVAFIPVMILSRSTGSVPTHPIANEISRDPFTLIFIMGLACIWAPVAEETFFRGMLFGYLRRRRHWVAAGILTGFIFAVIHPQGWIAVPLLGTIGFTLSAIREWRGSIIAPMTAHALNNGSVLLIAILMLT